MVNTDDIPDVSVAVPPSAKPRSNNNIPFTFKLTEVLDDGTASNISFDIAEQVDDIGSTGAESIEEVGGGASMGEMDMDWVKQAAATAKESKAKANEEKDSMVAMMKEAGQAAKANKNKGKAKADDGMDEMMAMMKAAGAEAKANKKNGAQNPAADDDDFAAIKEAALVAKNAKAERDKDATKKDSSKKKGKSRYAVNKGSKVDTRGRKVEHKQGANVVNNNKEYLLKIKAKQRERSKSRQRSKSKQRPKSLAAQKADADN